MRGTRLRPTRFQQHDFGFVVWVLLRQDEYAIGLTTRLMAKVTNHLFKHFLRLHLLWCGYSQFSVDVLTIQSYLLRVRTKFK